MRRAKAPNIVYLGPASLLQGVLAELEDRISLTWIVSAASEAEAKTVERELSYEASIYFVVRDYLDVPEFTLQYRSLSSHSSKTAEDLRVISVIGAVTEMLASDGGNCSNEENDEPKSEGQVRKLLQISSESHRYNIRQLHANESLLIGEYADERLILNEEEESTLVSDSALYPWPCLDCQCTNLPVVSARGGEIESYAKIGLRRETWLTVMLTVAAVGCAVAVTIGCYIYCKSCSEVVEGSQAFSLLLLFSAILVYGCLLAFAVNLDTVPSGDFFCALRLHSVPVAYSILFSVLLSRSLMLATADFDGLPGHISGLTQTFLFVILAGLQVALSVQEWFIRERPYSELVVIGRVMMTSCPGSSKFSKCSRGQNFALILILH